MKKAKLLSILTTTLAVLFALTTVVSAISVGGQTVGADTDNLPTGLVSSGNRVIGIIQAVGTIVAVAMVLILGIKYMMGSSEEKAANKKSMMPYLIGAICLFIGSNLVKIIADWAATLTAN